ncbi:FAD-dependent oxidoreductase [Streptomyces sp. NPDC057748]|uniref:FAD-dependent oxidoreductase n=1 Tax=unclassified Streptomyces TaxID=2593676 RepID=UPI0036B4C38F
MGSHQAANSALRVQATAMATGQAAGALAAMTADRGTDVTGVPMADLHRVLVRSGAIVPTLPADAGV